VSSEKIHHRRSVENLPTVDDGPCERVLRLVPLRQHAFRPDQGVYGMPEGSAETCGCSVEPSFYALLVRGLCDNAEDVDVARSPHLSSGHASKQDDADRCRLHGLFEATGQLLPIRCFRSE